ncbi:hypothetical protein C6382_08180 [Pseudomonas sp. BBP2017]|nr:hypothetical protein C6382_08180 [Pseudomonas sp. BBP2017]
MSDVALSLTGFWRGFRGDELARLQVEHIQDQAAFGQCLYKRLFWCTFYPALEGLVDDAYIKVRVLAPVSFVSCNIQQLVFRYACKTDLNTNPGDTSCRSHPVFLSSLPAAR